MSAHDDYTEFVNAILENATDDWDADEAAEAIAVDYVRHLESEVRRLGGRFYPWADDAPPDFLAACQPTPDTNRLSSLAYILDRYDALEARTGVKATKADKEARERAQELLADLRAALARVSGGGEGVTSA